MSTEQKKPQAGEWWRDADEDRLYVVGKTPSGELVCVDAYKTTYVFAEVDDYDHWHYEPLCTGFDLQPKPDEPAEVKSPDMDAIQTLRDFMGTESVLKYASLKVRQALWSVIALAERAIHPVAEQKPEWPKWYVHRDQSVCWFRKIYETGPWLMCEQHFPTTTHGTYTLGDFGADDKYFIIQGYWIEVTETEALARVTPAVAPGNVPVAAVTKHDKHQSTATWTAASVNNRVACEECLDYAADRVGVPVESPDDWVPQDREPARDGIDQWRWVNEDGEPLSQWRATETKWRGTHGGGHDGYFFRVQCRRRDLPKQPLTAETYGKQPVVNRVAVRLYWYDGNIVGRYEHSQPMDESFQEIRSDGNGGWFIEVQK